MQQSALEQTTFELGQKVFGSILNPLIQIGFLLALVYFLFGIMNYILKGKDDEKARSTGSQHMLWGTIGLTIMFTAVGITYFIGNTGDKLLDGQGSTDDIQNVVGELQVR